ncbi:MAG: membrane protein insertase YidC [Arsenophonus sp.]|nr:MAG: membrane protein insertase YidC [Arsenophonus sp.]
MDLQRNFIFILFLCFSFILWKTWEYDKIKNITKQTTFSNENEKYFYEKKIKNNEKNIIKVKTDVLDVSINLIGGNIEKASLLNYKKNIDSLDPYVLLENEENNFFQIKSGLIKNNNFEFSPIFDSEKKTYILKKNQNEIFVLLNYLDQDKVSYQKKYTFKREKYSIFLEYIITNSSNKKLNYSFYYQIIQSKKLKHNNTKNNFILHNYRGAAYFTEENNYKKYSFDDIKNKKLNIIGTGGWISMLEQYFLTAWIPSSQEKNTFYTTDISEKDLALIGYETPIKKVNPLNKISYKNILWIGPKLQEELSIINNNLHHTIDYGWFWFISEPLFTLLKFINNFIGNWGFSIIFITFILRGIMYPLTKAQYTSMAKLRLLQPKIEAIKTRFSHDKHKLSQEMISLYKKENVNPFGGCLPLLIQMPVFLALYYMLISSVELFHAPFFGWIKDLSSSDPYYILPIFMGITMYIIQKMSPTTITDPVQKKIMLYIPIIFTIFFLWFPTGLVLYYIVSNLVTIIQQQMIYKSLEKRGLYFKNK